MDDLSDYRRPGIEPDAFDDAEGHGYDPLDRWGDARFSEARSRWALEGHPMTDWRA